jgi:response regulator of citrate/malate metabolism
MMVATTPEVATKRRVLKAFKDAAPLDLSISEAGSRARVSDATAATYIKVLVAGGVLEESRRIGNAKLFRVR